MEVKKRFRMDFILEEIIPICKDKRGTFYRFRMVPDPRSWERSEINGESGYLNKFDGTFISDKVMAESVKTMKNIPITISTVEIGNEKEYINKSRKRIKKEKL